MDTDIQVKREGQCYRVIRGIEQMHADLENHGRATALDIATNQLVEVVMHNGRPHIRLDWARSCGEKPAIPAKRECRIGHTGICNVKLIKGKP